MKETSQVLVIARPNRKGAGQVVARVSTFKEAERFVEKECGRTLAWQVQNEDTRIAASGEHAYALFRW